MVSDHDLHLHLHVSLSRGDLSLNYHVSVLDMTCLDKSLLTKKTWAAMGAKRGAPRNVLNALAGWEVSPCDCVGLGIQKFIYLLLLIHNLKETAERGALGL